MKQLTKWSIENRLSTLVLTIVIMVGGWVSFNNLGRLEDPEFTIKDVQIITPYPGASAEEVEEEVTERVEKACQELGQLKKPYLKSQSMRGLSIVTAKMKDQYDKASLPQVWDELRRKIGDMQKDLPPGAGPSLVNDDFGDVYGIYLAVTADGYTPAELKEYLKVLQKELLKCTDVKKVTLTALQSEAIYIEPNRERLAALGIPYSNIGNAIRSYSQVADGGRFLVGSEYITLVPSGAFSTVEQIENMLIPVANSTNDVYLKDIATVRRGYVEPLAKQIRYDGQMAAGIGISTVLGGNVVDMGESVRAKLKELEPDRPVGIELNTISFQSDAVSVAIDGFLVNLLEAVIIVVLVLMFFMGIRSALIIGFVLIVTIFATFIVMAMNGVDLQKISLGALIIALGMLVDNAIVVLDGMLVRMEKGEDPKEAAVQVVGQTALPLAGATAIAILAFAAIGTSQDSTGEFTKSLYQVILYSLGLSWVTAVTITPLLGVMYLKKPVTGAVVKDPYNNSFFNWYRKLIGIALTRRYLVVMIVFGVFVLSLYGFKYVKTSFFPASTRPQFMVNVWLPQGTHVDSTAAISARVAEAIKKKSGVTHVTTIIGSGPLRFILTLAPENVNSSYFQALVDVDDYKKIVPLIHEIDAEITELVPNGLAYCDKFQMGSADPKIEARFYGPDRDTIRMLAQEFIERSQKTDVKALRMNWRQRVKIIDVELAEEQANLNGVTIADVSEVLKEAYDGSKVGIFREGDELLPITVRAAITDRANINQLQSLEVWSPKAERMIPLRQVVKDFNVAYEDEVIWRRERVRVLTVQGEAPMGMMVSDVQKQLEEVVTEMKIPQGYELRWGGEKESSSNAVKSLTKLLPVIFVIMFLILVLLFNSLKIPLLIWAIVPLAMIGVTAGLLGMNLPFGFMSILGVLSLSGMLIKNAIVLIDQINENLKNGMFPYDAVVESGVSRLRPVAMAAGTTALGMIPLFVDPFFAAMAVTIVAGLCVATLLTVFLVPVLYAIFFNVHASQEKK